MQIVVQKFGGSSIAEPELIKNVAQRVVQTKEKGNKVVVVVSAMGDTTDELLELVNRITSSPCSRELDMLLSTGEQISIALMVMAINELGCLAPFDLLSFNYFVFHGAGIHFYPFLSKLTPLFNKFSVQGLHCFDSLVFMDNT